MKIKRFRDNHARDTAGVAQALALAPAECTLVCCASVAHNRNSLRAFLISQSTNLYCIGIVRCKANAISCKVSKSENKFMDRSYDLDPLQNVMGSSLAHATPLQPSFMEIRCVGFAQSCLGVKKTRQKK